MSVLEGVEADLAQLPEHLRESGLAAVAKAMAQRIDTGKGSPSECGKVVIEALSKLRDLSPPKREEDGVDELSNRRADRLRKPRAARQASS
jgi:hypothetical protein